jgi:hypothetical protein
MKYNLQLGCCLLTPLVTSVIAYILYWFYKSLAFNFTTLQSYIHCILLWLSYPQVCSCIYMQDKLWEIISVPGDHESPQRASYLYHDHLYSFIFISTLSYSCVQWMWSHFFYMYCSNNKVQILVLLVTYFPCWVSRRTHKSLLPV